MVHYHRTVFMVRRATVVTGRQRSVCRQYNFKKPVRFFREHC